MKSETRTRIKEANGGGGRTWMSVDERRRRVMQKSRQWSEGKHEMRSGDATDGQRMM